ncbi:MAG: cytochrome P450, partial [Acidobacteria bacterium]|nr:cytochrome P450 [Acidobacteriota bacterium]
MLRHFRKDAPGFLLETRERYGDVAFLRLSGQDVYLLNHPDYIRDVLVTNQTNFTKSRVLERSKRMLGEGLLTSEGQFHLRQRRMIQPAFHRERLRGYATAMTSWAIRTRDRWQAGQTIDMSEEMARLTLGIVGQT